VLFVCFKLGSVRPNAIHEASKASNRRQVWENG